MSAPRLEPASALLFVINAAAGGLDADAKRAVIGAVQAGTAVSSRTRPGVPNSVNLLRWGEASGGSGAPAQNGSEAGDGCLVERWGFARRDRGFVCTAVTPVRPERASLPGRAGHGTVLSIA
jgi:hypothetical protein